MRELFLAAILSTAACASTCPKAASVATDVRASRAELLKVEVGTEGMDPSVQPSTQAQISAFKDRLVQFADAVLACASSTETSPSTVQQALADELGPHEPKRVIHAPEGLDESVDGIFGSDITPIVSAPRPSFLFVELSFGIACGSDSVLLLYRQMDGRWKRILRWQSRPYDKVSEAFGDFFHYSLINDAKTNELAVIAAHGSPWCTSRWSGFNIDVLIPETGFSAQKQILHQEFGYVREEPVRWKTSHSEVELRTENAFLDPAVLTKSVIFKFRLEDGKLRRIQPIALNGADFVDEWLQVDWSEAQQWTSSNNLSSLQRTHDKIWRSENKVTEYEYSPLKACDASTFEAKILVNGIATFLKAKRLADGFTMLETSEQQTCSGPDIVVKR